MFFRFSILVAFLAMASSPVFGGLIVTMTPAAASYSAGTTAQVDLFVRADAGSQIINGFDLSFDLRSPSGGNIGQGLPTGVTLNGAFLSNTLTLTGGTGIALSGTQVAGADFYVNADGSTTVGTSDVRLFRMNFDIGAAASAGAYDLRFVPNALFTNFLDDQNNDIAPVTYNSGSFLVVTAVPEPSSMVLLGLVFAGAAGVRHRLRKKAQA